MVPGGRDVHLGQGQTGLHQRRHPSTPTNGPILSKMAHGQRHCQGLADKLNGPIVDWEFYQISNGKIGVGFHCNDVL
jgi:hypothetical protein